jgi:hypothetical protein
MQRSRVEGTRKLFGDSESRECQEKKSGKETKAGTKKSPENIFIILPARAGYGSCTWQTGKAWMIFDPNQGSVEPRC